MIKFFFNGQTYFCNTSKNITISEIIYYFNCQNEIFILEFNNIIYSKTQWKKIKLKNNDRVELVTIVGGG